MPQVQNFTMTAGEDRTLSLTARDYSNAIQSLTVATLAFRLSLNAGDGSLVAKTGSTVSAAAGTYTVSLDAADTNDLYGDYPYQTLATIAGDVSLVSKGIIRVQPMNQA